MARFSSSLAGSTSLSSGARFTNMQTTQAGMVAWTVPAGVTQIAVTGCAAGGNRPNDTNVTAPVDSAGTGYTFGRFATNGSFMFMATPQDSTRGSGGRYDVYTWRGGSAGVRSNWGSPSFTARGVGLSADGNTILQGLNGSTEIRRSTNGGRNVSSVNPGLGTNFIDFVFLPQSNTIVFAATSAGGTIGVSRDGGATWASLAGTPAGFSLRTLKTLDNMVVALGTATGNSRLGYTSDGVTWTWVDLGVTIGPNDIARSGSTFCIVGGSSLVLTATALNGAWTSRTWGGPAANICAIDGSGTRFVAGSDAGVANGARQSTDGITWTAISGTGTTAFGSKSVAWSPAGITSAGTWVISGAGSGNSTYVSTDGGVTFSLPSGSVGDGNGGYSLTPDYGVVGTPYGVIAVTSSGPAKYTSAVRQTPTATVLGGDATITVNRSGAIVELLRLETGLTSTDNSGGDGGSYVGARSPGGNNRPGAGQGGVGAVGTAAATTPASGNGGPCTGGNDNHGGGGAMRLIDIVALTGGAPNTLRFPGASGAGSTNYQGGGGSSIFGSGGTGGTSGAAPGPGGGANGLTASANGAAGGGEGVYRFSLTVVPGETLLINSGCLGSVGNSSGSPNWGNPGFLQWEWNQ